MSKRILHAHDIRCCRRRLRGVDNGRGIPTTSNPNRRSAASSSQDVERSGKFGGGEATSVGGLHGWASRSTMRSPRVEARSTRWTRYRMTLVGRRAFEESLHEMGPSAPGQRADREVLADTNIFEEITSRAAPCESGSSEGLVNKV